MTEAEAISIATEHVKNQQMKHDGFSHAVCIPADGLFAAQGQTDDRWYVYFEIPKHEGWERFIRSRFAIVVDGATGAVERIRN